MKKQYFSKIVGSTFVDGAQEVIKELKQGDKLSLIRDKDNKFDINAVAVFYFVKRIGYIPKATAESLAQILDKGIKVECEVSEITGKDKDNVGCNISISYED